MDRSVARAGRPSAEQGEHRVVVVEFDGSTWGGSTRTGPPTSTHRLHTVLSWYLSSEGSAWSDTGYTYQPSACRTYQRLRCASGTYSTQKAGACSPYAQLHGGTGAYVSAQGKTGRPLGLSSTRTCSSSRSGQSQRGAGGSRQGGLWYSRSCPAEHGVGRHRNGDRCAPACADHTRGRVRVAAGEEVEQQLTGRRGWTVSAYALPSLGGARRGSFAFQLRS